MAINNYYARETFGDIIPDGRSVDALGTADKLKLEKAALVIAGADGELSATELDHFLGMSMALGAPEQSIAELRKFDVKGAKLEDYVSADLKPFARGFLYGAIKTARADGYHEKEKAAARKAAKLLGIDEAIVTSIEALLDTEAAVRQMRLSLINPAHAK